jgi:SAM-dependent methyltransferase
MWWRTLGRLRSDWEGYAAKDPLWAILTFPEKKERRWEEGVFFETGRREIEELLVYAGSLGIPLGRQRALDFGCGVGRLTRALAAHFDQAYGVDISATMLQLARDYNAHLPNCTFVQNTDPALGALPAAGFDLIYSNLTLQHMPPRYIKRYLRGMAGRLRPGGLLIFQLPHRRQLSRRSDQLRSLLYEEIYRRYILRAEPSLAMYGVPKRRVLDLLEKTGCRVLDVTLNDAALPEWTGYRYAAVR